MFSVFVDLKHIKEGLKFALCSNYEVSQLKVLLLDTKFHLFLLRLMTMMCRLHD